MDFIERLNSIYSYWILPTSICLTKTFSELILCTTWVFIVILIEEKLNHVLKTDDDKLFNDLLTNKIFSKQILSWNFKMELYLKRGLVWEFLGWKIIILPAFFVKLQFVNSATVMSPDKRAVEWVGVENSKINGS